MSHRYMSIWFRHLLTDWHIIQNPSLKQAAFVIAAPDHGKMVIHAACIKAESEGIFPGMVVADARAVSPAIQVIEDDRGGIKELLNRLAKWCLRYTPEVSIDMPEGLLLDISGCTHLWNGEPAYLKELVLKLRSIGFDVRAAVADTIGCAWAVARYGQITPIIEPDEQAAAIKTLPAAALRLDPVITDRLQKLGLPDIGHFMDIPRANLRRRFGQELPLRLDQAMGVVREPVQAIHPLQPYQERLSSLEPILTATGIEIALRKLLEMLCQRLCREGKGVRTLVFTCYRIDNETQQATIGTSRPSRSPEHLFKLFEQKIPTIAPGWGIEVFVLEAPITEPLTAYQELLWNSTAKDEKEVAELLDKISIKIGADKIHRYLPDEHYWPERSYKESFNLQQQPQIPWPEACFRPIALLPKPEPIEVLVPIPDYPPMLFIYKGTVHKIKKADGPERIEREWWIEKGLQRDYYVVEDEAGARYWLFRSGHYHEHSPEWFLHGFFA